MNTRTLIFSIALLPALGIGRTAAPAELILAPPELDLGLRAAGETLRETVWLINAGNGPVELTGATGSCGCLAVDVAPQTLPPRAAVAVPISVTASTTPGKRKSVSVTFAIEGDEPLRLPVRIVTAGATRAAPRADVVAEPGAVDLGPVTAGARIAAAVRLINTGTAPRRISAARAGCPCITLPDFQPVTIAPGAAADVSFEIHAPSRTGAEAVRAITLIVDGQRPVNVPVRLVPEHPLVEAARRHLAEVYAAGSVFDGFRVRDETVTALAWTPGRTAPRGLVTCRFDDQGLIESTRFEAFSAGPLATKG